MVLLEIAFPRTHDAGEASLGRGGGVTEDAGSLDHNEHRQLKTNGLLPCPHLVPVANDSHKSPEVRAQPGLKVRLDRADELTRRTMASSVTSGLCRFVWIYKGPPARRPFAHTRRDVLPIRAARSPPPAPEAPRRSLEGMWPL